MLLHAPTIRHVLDCYQSIVMAAEDEALRVLLDRPYRSLSKIFEKELATLATPELLEKETVDEVLVRVGAYFNCTVRDLRDRDRHMSLSSARHVAAYLLRRRGLSFPEIGRVLERDHTTIMASCKRVELAIREPKASSVLGKIARAVIEIVPESEPE